MRNILLTAWMTALTAASAVLADTEAPPPGGQIRVSVEPDGATVTCNREPVSAPPVTITGLPPADHLVVVSKHGYQTEQHTVPLQAGQRVNLDVQLSPVLGLLLVHSDPKGADVEINGAYRGKTPLLATDLPLGEYRMALKSAGYIPKEVDLVLDSRTPRKVDLQLKSDSARLAISSEPAGARVVVNGVARGTAPCIVDRIPAGESSIELTLDAHKPHKQTVKLIAGDEQDITAVLEPIPASLNIVSIPTGARIYINNQFRGESPVELNGLPPGAYRVRAELAGHETMARTVQLKRAQELVEEFRLPSNTGMFELITEPAMVTVFVNGDEAGVTKAKPGQTDRVSEPLRIDQLTAGRHEVQLTRKGYFGARFPIAIERAKTVSLHKKLKKRFIPNCELVTKTAVHKGVLLEVAPNGDVKLEVNPGVIRTFEADEIRIRRPLRQDNE